jgi:hypothetical protein
MAAVTSPHSGTFGNRSTSCAVYRLGSLIQYMGNGSRLEASTVSAGRMDAMETTKSVQPGVAARAALLILGLLVLVATLTAYGGSSSSSSSSSSSGVSSSDQGARPSGNSSSDGDMVQSSGSSASSVSGAGGVGGSGEAAVAAPEDQEQGDSGSGGDASDFDRKVVKTANLGLRAHDVRETSREAQRLASSSGGSVLSSRIRRGEGGSFRTAHTPGPSTRVRGGTR